MFPIHVHLASTGLVYVTRLLTEHHTSPHVIGAFLSICQKLKDMWAKASKQLTSGATCLWTTGQANEKKGHSNRTCTHWSESYPGWFFGLPTLVMHAHSELRGPTAHAVVKGGWSPLARPSARQLGQVAWRKESRGRVNHGEARRNQCSLRNPMSICGALILATD